MIILARRYALSLLALISLVSASAQPAGNQEEWSVSIGGGAIWAPAFSGSSDYQLMLVPSIRVNYGDTFFASVEQGIGYNAVNTSEWTAGPLIKFDFGRDADGESPFRIAGSKSTALIGFKDVDSTVQAGAFASYRVDAWSAKIELLQGVNGHEGLTGKLSLDYKMRLGSSDGRQGPPVFVSTGPRLSWGDADYTNTYYGITAVDSLATGLPAYRASGGVTSLGWSLSMVRPVSRELSVIIFAGYDKLMGDAADSPLIIQRGSEDQFSTGVFLSYKM